MREGIKRSRVWLALVSVIVVGVGAYLWRTVQASHSESTGIPGRAQAVGLPVLTATAEPSLTPWSSSTPLPSATATPSLQPTETTTPSPTATSTWTATPTTTVTPSLTPSPLPTPDGTSRVLRVPILMYHHIAAPPAGADAVRRDLSVSPKDFEEQLIYLREQGYVSITLHDLLLAVQRGEALPPKPVVLTFDDGYRDNYLQAFPLLQRYGYTGAFFVNAAFIDSESPEYMTWAQIEEMAAEGMDIEAHGYTHPDLRKVDMDELIFQILRPKEAIEARTHGEVRFFCYPSGQYDERVVRVLQSANYWGAVTLISGVEQRSDRAFEWQRIRVRGHYSVQELDHVLSVYMANAGG